MNNNGRGGGRYPPGIGRGGGGNYQGNTNPSFQQQRNYQQQYAQRNPIQNQQFQQQQQWLRRNSLGNHSSATVEVEKTMQSEGNDSRYNSPAHDYYRFIFALMFPQLSLQV